MVDTSYLLVAFHAEKEKNPGNAMRKTITQGDFKLLHADFQVDIDLNDVPYNIIDKRSFAITIAGCQHLVMIIDVKRK